MSRQRIDNHLGSTDVGLFRQEYEGLELRKPGHAILSDVTVEDDAIYANPGFFDRYGNDPDQAVRTYLMQLCRASGKWIEIQL